MTGREDYLDWENYFMATALLASKRSNDPVTQVGACIVNEDNVIVGVGYNGMPRGQDDLFPWTKGGDLDNKHLYVCHAELNAIVNKNSADLKNCRLYSTLCPCNECAKLLIQSGIREVIYLSDKYGHKPEFQTSKIMMDAVGVKYKQFLPKERQTVINWNDNDN